MAKFNDPRTYHRPVLGSLLFTREGDLDLSWLFVLLIGMAGISGFIWVNIFAIATPIAVKIASWSFLGAAFAAVLIAAVPVAKAKILAKASLPSELATGIAKSASAIVETSTDVMELSNKSNVKSSELG